MKKLYVLVSILFITSGCSIFKGNKIAYSKPDITDEFQSNWDKMLGKWYGVNTTEDGEVREFIDERNSDGTYFIEFHTIDKKGNVSIQKEYGEWGISGNIYFTTVEAIEQDSVQQTTDKANPYYQDAYKITKLTETTFTYKHVGYGDKFSVKKVDSQFKFTK